MKGMQIIVEGNWAHFKKPETNNNPLTHDFITKTAFVGLIGAVLGKERSEMRPLFPQLCDDLLYGVEVLGIVKKEAWSFTLRKAVNLYEKAPKSMEFLKTPQFKIALALKCVRSEEIFDLFSKSIEEGKAVYTPVMGLHNCPAILTFVSKQKFSEKKEGGFNAKCFVSAGRHTILLNEVRQFRIGFEKIPTFQNDDFWNLPDRYERVIYPSESKEITCRGEYYEYQTGEQWWLI